MKELYSYILKGIKDGNLTRDEGIKLIDKVKHLSDNNEFAIIGMSGMFPQANNIEEFWDNLKKQKCSIRKMPQYRINQLKGITESVDFDKMKIAGYLEYTDAFDYDFFNISPKEAITMDPLHRIIMQNVIHVFEDAGISLDDIYGSNTGIFIGNSSDFGTEYRNILMKSEPLENFAATGNIHTMIYGRIAHFLNLSGPAMIIDTACSSFLSALHIAMSNIQQGLCNMAIVASAKIASPYHIDSEIFLGVESPNGICKPFNNNTEGIANGEGAGCILIKPLKRAVDDNDRIHAIIKGHSINQDGKTISLAAPNPEAQKNLLINACRNANISIEEISYIETHGTGTKLGDNIELQGIKNAFETETQKKQFCGIGSVKSNIGHLDCASGVASVIKCILQMKNKLIVPSLFFDEPNQNFKFHDSPIYVVDSVREWCMQEGKKRICAINSFSVSGTNNCIILQEYEKDIRIKSDKDDYNVLVLSARSEETLRALVYKYKKFIEKSNSPIQDICFTASSGRKHYEYRIAFVFDSREELHKQISYPYESINKCKGVFIGIHKVGVNNSVSDRYKKSYHEIKVLSEKADEIVEKKKNGNYIITINDNYDLAKLYVEGANINWDAFYNGKCNKVSLPLYPFLEKHLWSEIKGVEQNTQYNVSKLEDSDSKENITSTIDICIRNIWIKLLGLKTIPPDSSFFNLGGNSLLAIKFEIEMQKKGFPIAFDILKKYDTIESLSDYLKSSKYNSLITKKETVISDIEPFNDVYFKDCFYNSFFPILNLMKRNNLAFLVTWIQLYEIVDNGITAVYKDLKTFDKICQDIGLMVTMRNSTENIVKYIKDCLDKSQPVIVYVDCYQESIREETYQKMHWPHTWLVYGYSDEKNVFNIIEHMNKDNLNYGEYEISYSDTEACYKSYLDNFNLHLKKPTIYSFCINEQYKKPQIEYKEVFLENVCSNFEEIQESLGNLEQYSDVFDRHLDSELEFMKNLDEKISLYNNIINLKKVELYRLEQLCVSEKTISAIKEIITLWEKIRRISLKCCYLNEYCKTLVITLKGVIKKIVALEKILIQHKYS